MGTTFPTWQAPARRACITREHDTNLAPFALAHMSASLLAALAVGFSVTPSQPNAPYVLRWSNDQSGLKGGLGFAVEPDFCEKMMPQFTDRRYIYCSYLQSAMLRAFETWAINHPDISFVNVTEICATEDAVTDCMNEPGDLPPEEVASGTGSGEDISIGRGNCTKLCSAAQIFILAEHLQASDGSVFSLPTSVGLWGALGLTSNAVIQVGVSPPLTTSGVTSNRDPRINRAVLTVNRAQPFYLDSTFCAGMHRINAQGMDALVVFSLVMMPIFACALVGLLVRLGVSMSALCKSEKKGTCDKLIEALHLMSTPIWLTWFMLTAGIVCPYTYYNIAEPCVRNFDFEASFTRAIGEALGLSDPTLTGTANYEMTTPLNTSNCVGDVLALPSQSTMLQSTSFTAGMVGDGPLMMTPSQTRAERCPSLDDLQGLNFLYPTCSLSRQSNPLCVKSNISLGLVTFMGVVVLGVILSYVCVVFVSYSTGYLMRRSEVAYEAGEQGTEEEEVKAKPVKARADTTKAKAATYQAAEMTSSRDMPNVKRSPPPAVEAQAAARAGGSATSDRAAMARI